MHPRARALIERLQLQPHPEGGHYRRIHTAAAIVTPPDARGPRPAMTMIHYLLAAGETSHWHRVNSDEIWHHAEGAPLELLTATPDLSDLHRLRLGPLDDAHATPTRVVPAGHWQAARSMGDYTLVSCIVAPGFDFADFSLLRDHPALVEVLLRRQPGTREFL